MKKIIISVIVIILLLSAVTVTIMYKMGEKFLDEMITAEIEDLIEIPSENTDKSSSGKDNNKVSSSDTIDDNSSNPQISENTSNSSINNQENTKINKESNSVNEKNETPQKVMTKEKLEDIKEKITFTDKMTAATLVVKRLNTEDISVLKDLASGDFTDEEKEKAKEIAYSRFTPEEISEIKEIYHKYMEK